ncbi:MAG: GNAT family N-acetyltransferase, partial [Lachnospiraceae bacterium]|nr:GNAT family N-acetyltransferase [Lachnospiraceae bacterium]
MEKKLKKKSNEFYNLQLRPYKTCDAKTIVSWIHDEISLRKWSADRYESFPVTEEDMNKKYMNCNGDCPDMDNFYPMTAFDESGVVGHLIMRFTDEEKRVLRFGFVIVDDAKRGRGYGKQMLLLALKYAFDILKAAKVTLGVFENNEAAYYCYKAAGFKEIALEKEEYYSILGQKWKCIEMEIINAGTQEGFLYEGI